MQVLPKHVGCASVNEHFKYRQPSLNIPIVIQSGEKRHLLKSSIWLQRIFHWCIVTGDFPSPALLPRTGSETEPDVRVFTDTAPPTWCLAALLATAVAPCSWSWMLRLFWHSACNDNDPDFYGYGIKTRWWRWLKKLQVHELYSWEKDWKPTLICFSFHWLDFTFVWKPREANF